MRECQIRLRHRDDGGFSSPFLITHDNLPWWQPKRTYPIAWWDLYSRNYREIGTQSPTYRRPNSAKIFFVQFSFYFSFADLEHEIWATITVSWILLLGLIVYPFPGAVSLSPALKSAAKQLLELILCLTFRWYWTGVLNWKYNRHCSLFPKKLLYWRTKDCNKVFTRSKSCAMEGS